MKRLLKATRFYLRGWWQWRGPVGHMPWAICWRVAGLSLERWRMFTVPALPVDQVADAFFDKLSADMERRRNDG